MTREEYLKAFQAFVPNTLMETLGIEYTDLDLEAGVVQATMPVGPRVHQPMGLLHGGASAALAESLGSAASALYANPQDHDILGINLECSHLRSKRSGMVTATGTLVHRGRKMHLWHIKISDEEGKLISDCKLTNLIVPRTSASRPSHD
jgi:uncharacterized domain 1